LDEFIGRRRRNQIALVVALELGTHLDDENE